MEVDIDKPLAPGAKVVCLWKDSREGVIIRDNKGKFVAALRPKGNEQYKLEGDKYANFKLIFEAYTEDDAQYKLMEPELERQLAVEKEKKGPRTAYDSFL